MCYDKLQEFIFNPTKIKLLTTVSLIHLIIRHAWHVLYMHIVRVFTK